MISDLFCLVALCHQSVLQSRYRIKPGVEGLPQIIVHPIATSRACPRSILHYKQPINLEQSRARLSQTRRVTFALPPVAAAAPPVPPAAFISTVPIPPPRASIHQVAIPVPTAPQRSSTPSVVAAAVRHLWLCAVSAFVFAASYPRLYSKIIRRILPMIVMWSNNLWEDLCVQSEILDQQTMFDDSCQHLQRHYIHLNATDDQRIETMEIAFQINNVNKGQRALFYEMDNHFDSQQIINWFSEFTAYSSLYRTQDERDKALCKVPGLESGAGIESEGGNVQIAANQNISTFSPETATTLRHYSSLQYLAGENQNRRWLFAGRW